jgi:hypothetical protein
MRTVLYGRNASSGYLVQSQTSTNCAKLLVAISKSRWDNDHISWGHDSRNADTGPARIATSTR